MANSPNKLSQFWQELKRRNVVRVMTVYAGAAFVILELVDIIAEPLKLPSWLLPVVIVLLSIGFIIAIILSWIYDIHPEGGMIKTEPVPEQDEERPEKHSQLLTWKIATYVSVAVIIGLILYNIFGTIRSIDHSGLDGTIAVLPFEIVGQDTSIKYLKDALPIALISELQQVEEYDKAIEILDGLLSKPGLISVNLLKKDPAWEKLWNRDEFNKMLNKHS